MWDILERHALKQLRVQNGECRRTNAAVAHGDAIGNERIVVYADLTYLKQLVIMTSTTWQVDYRGYNTNLSHPLGAK